MNGRYLIAFLFTSNNLFKKAAGASSNVAIRSSVTTIPTTVPTIPFGSAATCQKLNGTYGGVNSAEFSERIFAREQLESFERDGFLVVSGLLDDRLEDFVEAGETFVTNAKKMKAYFSALEMGMIFDAGKSDDPSVIKAFRDVVFESVLPRAVAELMKLPPTENVRVLRYVNN